MRNMSFAATVPQMRDRTKTVTRRLGWKNLVPNEILMAVEKGMGLKNGEKIKRIHPIRITAVWEEQVCAIMDGDARLEGFPHMTDLDFIVFFCREMKCDPQTVVTRIEFEHLEWIEG